MIGIFDSGFGGLSMLSELYPLMPKKNYLYLGDSLHTPYGGRSQEAITELSQKGVSFLFDQGAQIVLIACNTASADALRTLQMQFSQRKILGVLVPTVEEALTQSRFGRIGLIATRGTVETGNYEKEIQKRAPDFYAPQDSRAHSKPKLLSIACPLLVPLVEEGWISKPETRSILKKYILSLKHAHIDTLILGCTHYGLLEKEFQRKMGKQVRVINSGRAQAQKFVEYYERHSELSFSEGGSIRFFTTDCPDRFREIGSRFLGKSIGKNAVKKVVL